MEAVGDEPHSETSMSETLSYRRVDSDQNGGTVADQDLARTVYLAFGVQQTMIAVKGGATWSQMVMKKKRKIQ